MADDNAENIKSGSKPNEFWVATYYKDEDGYYQYGVAHSDKIIGDLVQIGAKIRIPVGDVEIWANVVEIADDYATLQKNLEDIKDACVWDMLKKREANSAKPAGSGSSLTSTTKMEGNKSESEKKSSWAIVCYKNAYLNHHFDITSLDSTTEHVRKGVDILVINESGEKENATVLEVFDNYVNLQDNFQHIQAKYMRELPEQTRYTLMKPKQYWACMMHSKLNENNNNKEATDQTGSIISPDSTDNSKLSLEHTNNLKLSPPHSNGSSLSANLSDKNEIYSDISDSMDSIEEDLSQRIARGRGNPTENHDTPQPSSRRPILKDRRASMDAGSSKSLDVAQSGVKKIVLEANNNNAVIRHDTSRDARSSKVFDATQRGSKKIALKANNSNAVIVNNTSRDAGNSKSFNVTQSGVKKTVLEENNNSVTAGDTWQDEKSFKGFDVTELGPKKLVWKANNNKAVITHDTSRGAGSSKMFDVTQSGTKKKVLKENNSNTVIARGTSRDAGSSKSVHVFQSGAKKQVLKENVAIAHNTTRDMVGIGTGRTEIPRVKYEGMSWHSYTNATRKLLMEVFSRETLATHTLTGKPSPAFHGRETQKKDKLDERKVNDIVQEVSKNCSISHSIVRSAITTKCADENKMYKKRLEKGRKEHKKH